jgi:hypothetical protein
MLLLLLLLLLLRACLPRRRPDAEVLIAASDGVWEFITSEEALALVWQHRDDASKARAAPRHDDAWLRLLLRLRLRLVRSLRFCAAQASKLLIEESTIRWRKAEGNYRDDITAIVVFLPIFSVLSGEPSIKSGSCAPRPKPSSPRVRRCARALLSGHASAAVAGTRSSRRSSRSTL